jgi:hypothetical protein
MDHEQRQSTRKIYDIPSEAFATHASALRAANLLFSKYLLDPVEQDSTCYFTFSFHGYGIPIRNTFTREGGV